MITLGFRRTIPTAGRLVALLILVVAPTAVRAQQPASSGVDFRQQIQPVLARNCYACHGPDEQARQGDLRLDVEADAKRHAIVAGDAAASPLVARIFAEDPDHIMPPADTVYQLTSTEQQLIKRWIEAGADWQSHWAFEPIGTQFDVDWTGNEHSPIDYFIDNQLEIAGIEPAPPADKVTLLRRVYMDLIGLPPTIEQRDHFLADTSPNAFAKVVDHLLDSPAYGEQMAVAWLDAARFADTNGYQNDFHRSMWPWRDWVIQAFNRNLPYDQFIVEQIAGDLLPDASREQLIATGFNRNNRSVTEGGAIEEEWRIENCVDRVETTAAAFLGLTMGCARCHDHKYDPISQQEFYQFFAFFNNIDEKGVYFETRGNVAPLLDVPTAKQAAELADVQQQITLLQQESDGRPADWQQQLEALQARFKELSEQAQTTMIMRDRPEYRETHLLKRGQYDQPDESQPLWPAIPAALPQLSDDQPPNRLGLAKWMVDPRNPLVARVAVNRAWLKFFGRGLVDSVDNFGLQGSPPTHPLLLDWLAGDFRTHGWDLKRLHKLIVLSASYQRSSSATPEALAKDLSNKFFARGPRYRLSAEQVRDAALARSGLLVQRVGGASVFPYQPEGLWDELAGGAGGGPYVQSQQEDLYRRSLYTFRKRTVSHPVLATLDAPSWEVCLLQRPRTNTPLQALALLNDVTYVEAARNLAQRMLLETPAVSDSSRQATGTSEVADSSAQAEAWIGYGFELVNLRRPSQSELEKLVAGYLVYSDFYSRHPEQALALTQVGDSSFQPQLDPKHLAGLTAVASVLLNLDEALTKN